MTDTADLPQELLAQVRALSPAQKAALRTMLPELNRAEIEEADPIEIVIHSV